MAKPQRPHAPEPPSPRPLALRESEPDRPAEPFTPEGPPPLPSEPRPVWRSVAFCVKACAVYFGTDLVHLLGGTIIPEPDRVLACRRDPEHFEIFELESPQALDDLRAHYERMVSGVREHATRLGLVVYRDGEVLPPKR